MRSDESFPWCRCCKVSKMRDAGTRLVVSTGGNKKNAKGRIASGTKLQANHGLSGKLSDYLVERLEAVGGLYYVVELKSRVQHVEQLVAQLQAGANLLESHCPPRPLVAVVVKSRRLGPIELRLLRQRQVIYRGSRVPIRIVNSGTNLPNM
jgi:hypothetical protein